MIKNTDFGVCVGMQMLAKSSEEGKLNGLGWIDAIVKGLTLLMALFCPTWVGIMLIQSLRRIVQKNKRGFEVLFFTFLLL